ncbi:MAG: hypothetical protein H6661_11470 [Ardenticatenaceae bacterium]|nr:hypothetical protein [Ardenticatenaceae bacterium]
MLQLRRDVFAATIQHDMSFFDEHPSGKIVSRITSDTQDFAATVTLTMSLLSQVLLILVMTTWLFSINVWLTLLLIGMSPVAVAIALSFRKIARGHAECPPRDGDYQRPNSGIGQRHHRGQELPARNGHLRLSTKLSKLNFPKTGVQRGPAFGFDFSHLWGWLPGLGTALLILPAAGDAVVDAGRVCQRHYV